MRCLVPKEKWMLKLGAVHPLYGDILVMCLIWPGHRRTFGSLRLLSTTLLLSGMRWNYLVYLQCISLDHIPKTELLLFLFAEIVAVLKGHTGLVKGVTWDPIGKYLSSQSEDKSLRIWRTVDWQTEIVITEPYEKVIKRLPRSDSVNINQSSPFCFVILWKCGTTVGLRHDWSPDGQYLVSAHAMNNSGPTARIIERDGWKYDKDYVGHRKAVNCIVSLISFSISSIDPL